MNAHPYTTFRSDDTALKTKINLGNIDAAQCLLTAYRLNSTPGAAVNYNYIADNNHLISYYESEGQAYGAASEGCIGYGL